MVGTGDTISMKNNYITKTAGRGPALSGKTLLHAVNNVWDDIKGHMLEGGEATARGIFEGNVFSNVQNVVADYKGKLFGSPDANTNKQCSSALGRACEVNLFQGSTVASSLTSLKDTSFFGEFKDLTVPKAAAASSITQTIPARAGTGKLAALAGRSNSMRFKD